MLLKMFFEPFLSLNNELNKIFSMCLYLLEEPWFTILKLYFNNIIYWNLFILTFQHHFKILKGALITMF